MSKNKKIIMVMGFIIILSLLQWGLSYSTVFVGISMVLIYFLIKGKEISNKNKYTKIIYKIYKAIILLFLGSFILLQSAIFINMNNSKDVNKVGKFDTMIILGAKANGNKASITLKQRLDKAIEYYNKYNDVNIIVSGGKGDNENMCESLVMKNYLIKNNVNKNKIIMEDKARTTLENIRFSKKIIKDLNLSDEVLIVTSDYHLFRGQLIATILGLKNKGLCSESSLSGRIYYMIREYGATFIDLYRSVKIKTIY